MSNKPKLFIASSVEALSVAEAVNIKLEYDFQVKQWDNAFDLSSITLVSLIEIAEDTDYGVFVFHPDDEAIIRDNAYSVVRDNVLFELGLFIGALGLKCCFVLTPRSIETEFRLPTDLAGVTMTSYDDQLEDKTDAVTPSCAKIKQTVKKSTQTQEKPDSNENQLRQSQSQIWRLNIDLERAIEQQRDMGNAVKNHFFSVAKPATESEIKAWELGAKERISKT